jgi:hypothetical protein
LATPVRGSSPRETHKRALTLSRAEEETREREGRALHRPSSDLAVLEGRNLSLEEDPLPMVSGGQLGRVSQSQRVRFSRDEDVRTKLVSQSSSKLGVFRRGSDLMVTGGRQGVIE